MTEQLVVVLNNSKSTEIFALAEAGNEMILSIESRTSDQPYFQTNRRLGSNWNWDERRQIYRFSHLREPLRRYRTKPPNTIRTAVEGDVRNGTTKIMPSTLDKQPSLESNL